MITGRAIIGRNCQIRHNAYIRGDVIIGVTTASVVWVLAAIGALIGAGEFAGAVTMAIVTVVCLTVFDYLERWIQKHR